MATSTSRIWALTLLLAASAGGCTPLPSLDDPYQGARFSAPAPTQAPPLRPANGFTPVPDASAVAAPYRAPPPAPAPAAPQSLDPTADYRLGSGDKIRVTVYGEMDLSGEYEVDGSGDVRLPLAGQAHAAGLTTREFENVITQRLTPNYLKTARVNVDVMNYRPFFIIGEVNRPGQYAYVNGMNVITAVALAGGYTYRANDSDIYVRRDGKPETELPASERTSIKPGDILRVAERFF